METKSALSAKRNATPDNWSIEHYLRMILHRKWIILGTFALVSVATILVVSRLPDVFTSETVILVDPQKVPETYVKATVSGDIRGRLGTLSQQILSATRLQKIIDSLNLYPSERKTMAREDVITRMRADITVSAMSEFGGTQQMQAFRIKYSGKDARLVAQVTNELAALFIEENLKAREQQATGTAEFLNNQLQDTRKALTDQEAKIRDFKLKHVGEMPEQQSADLQILGQVQSQLQLESDALSRAEQQRSYIQSMMSASSPPVLDVDDGEQPQKAQQGQSQQRQGPSALSAYKAKLTQLLAHYSEFHPDVQRLKRQIAEEEAKQEKQAAAPAAAASENEKKEVATEKKKPPIPVATRSNPVLQSQLNALDTEIAKHKSEHARLAQLVSKYQVKLEAIPVREQEITALLRDYEISKVHYQQLLEKQLSAQTATDLEIRQKGETFSILDPAQPAQRPSKPNRLIIDLAGSICGLALGVGLALVTEIMGSSITTAEQITASIGLPVLEVIPVIDTRVGRRLRRKRLILSFACGSAATILAVAGFILYRYRYLVQVF